MAKNEIQKKPKKYDNWRYMLRYYFIFLSCSKDKRQKELKSAYCSSSISTSSQVGWCQSVARSIVCGSR